MLAISPLRPHTKDGREQGEVDITSFSVLGDHFADFPDFAAPVGSLLDTIDFDNLIHDGDVLPDLEMDPADFMAEFSAAAGDLLDEESSDTGNQVVPENPNTGSGEDECKNSATEASINDDESEKSTSSTRPAKEREKSKKHPSSQAKKNNNNNQGKRKTKVDWTPDLHRRFVQAVEQLGVDKAVPSRILDLMGVHCLTRHNVASHLQKYRSHRKHFLAREAEAASWSQRRQMYGVAVAPAGGGGGKSKVEHPWHPPTIGFPPMTPPPVHHHHPFRPLHVWGQPQSLMPVWPTQLLPSPSPPWAAPPPLDPSFWHPHHQHVPNAVTPTTSCFPQTMPATRFATAPPVPGIPPPHAAMYKPQQAAAPNHPPLDLHPTKESIDAAIGDVISKPWLPLPIGLKPPSMDSVMVELQRQGVPTFLHLMYPNQTFQFDDISHACTSRSPTVKSMCSFNFIFLQPRSMI